MGAEFLRFARWARAIAPDRSRARPLSRPIPILSAKDRAVFRTVEIGRSGTGFTPAQLVHAPIFEHFVRTGLVVEIVDGALKVSTTITDAAGRVAGELVHNEWADAAASSAWNRTYSENALEIRDPTGRIVLQLELGADRIHLQGEWWRDDVAGARLVEGDDPAHPGAFVMYFGPHSRPRPPEIRSIFGAPR